MSSEQGFWGAHGGTGEARGSLGWQGGELGSMGQGHAEGRGVLRDFGGASRVWGCRGGGRGVCTHTSGNPAAPRPSSARRDTAPGSRDLRRGGVMAGGAGNPPNPLPGSNPPPSPPRCSQLRLRALSTRVSPRSSLCRWKMSVHRMVSWKQSWGFPSMRTPPFRISVQGQVQGVSMGRGGLQPHGDTQL